MFKYISLILLTMMSISMTSYADHGGSGVVTIKGDTNILSLLSSQKVETGSSTQIKINGGTPPFKYEMKDGYGTVSSTGVYKAPTSIGTSWIRATDSKSKYLEFQMTIVVPEKPAVSASLSTVVASPTYAVADGVSSTTITVTLLDINGAPAVGRSITLTSNNGLATASAPGTTNSQGKAVFTAKSTVVQDVSYTAKDTTDNVTVTQVAIVSFFQGLKLNLLSLNMKINETIQLTALGGYGALVYSLVPDANGETGGILTNNLLTATGNKAVITVKVTDSVGDFDTVDIQVAVAGIPHISQSSAISALSDVLINSSTTITVLLRDLNGNPVPGRQIDLSNDAGNKRIINPITFRPSLTPAIPAMSGITDLNGKITFTINGDFVLVNRLINFIATDVQDALELKTSIQFLAPYSSNALSSGNADYTPNYDFSTGTALFTPGITYSAHLCVTDDQSMPMPNREIILSTLQSNTTLTQISTLTDKFGCLTFTISSSVSQFVEVDMTDMLNPQNPPIHGVLNHAFFNNRAEFDAAILALTL